MVKQRLQKIMASAGIDSRRNCEEIILSGVVKVNRKTIDTLPAFADTDTDEITVDGRKLRYAQKVYYLLNKPKGVICTNHDPQGRRKAIDFIKTSERIFCVGRLDADTTGAIILTNDTELANKLTHPKFGTEKTYLVGIKGKITASAVEKLKKGIRLAERKTSPAKVKVLNSGYTRSSVQITISEGLNRQIRRMVIKTGYKVISLKRTQIGRLTVRGIGPGSSRKLTKSEIAYLKK
ncbi:MAG: pseudouridine synthase [Planctomycetes bacterium]|nr:pseudouridine synthase [Planctomycetota bacterium]